MKKQWGSVELLRHSRHDWLNHIQLIKANLSLNRIDRANEIIDEITVQSHHESKLTNLKVPSIAEMLLTCNWQEHPYKVEVEVFGRERDLSKYERHLHDFFTVMFTKFDDYADKGHENVTKVKFQLMETATLISIAFTGVLNHHEEMTIEPSLHKELSIIEQYKSNESFVLILKIPQR